MQTCDICGRKVPEGSLFYCETCERSVCEHCTSGSDLCKKCGDISKPITSSEIETLFNDGETGDLDDFDEDDAIGDLLDIIATIHDKMFRLRIEDGDPRGKAWNESRDKIVKAVKKFLVGDK